MVEGSLKVIKDGSVMNNYLLETPILNFNHPSIQRVLRRLIIKFKTEEEIRAIYDFVRNEIKFGYNESDDIPASKVLQDGYGQCNTKEWS